MVAIKKIPAVRFKGFKEEWNWFFLEDLVDFYSGLTYSPKNVRKNAGTLVLRSSNVKNGEIIDADNVYVDTEVVNSINVRVGDIVIVVRNGSRSLIGKHAQIKREMANTVIGAFMTGIRYNYSSFINCLLDSPKFYKEIEKNLGATINQITIGAFKKMHFAFPNPSEQTQIGNYFKELDSLIQLQEQKQVKIINLKKAMLEKMFPKQNEGVPEVRFKEFTDKWEKKKLGEVVDDLYNGQTPSRIVSDFWNGDINWLSSGELNRGVVKKTIEKITVSGKKNANLKIVPAGTFVLAITGLEAVGTRGNCAILGIDTTMNQSCMAIYPNVSKLNTLFLFQWYRRFSEEIGIKYTQGTKQQSFNVAIIKKLEITLPNIEEQQKIGDYFQNLDQLINQSKQKITQLKNLKQALLQKMFI